MTGLEADSVLLRKAVQYLLDQGAAIDVIGDFAAPKFEIDGEDISASQVILKAYAAGMAEQG